MLHKRGALSKGELPNLIGGDPSTPALDRALNELWSILKITRVNYREKEGVYWDLLYHWSPKAVKDGVSLSLPEAISALLGKYLEAVVAADQDEIETVFSVLVSRSKIRDAVHALLAARELKMTTTGGKTLIQVTPMQTQPRSRVHG